MLFKLLIDFDSLSLGNLLGKGQQIKVALNSEPALTLLPDPWPASYPSRATITADFTAYESAYDLTVNGGSKAQREDRDQKRTKLILSLKNAAPYFESVAKAANDINVLTCTGYTLREPSQPVIQPLPAPVLQLRRNSISGVVVGRVKSLTGALVYEAQFCSGSPTGEESWQTADFTPRASQLEYTGLTPGQSYSFRARALGRGGWGGWSDITQMIAT